MINTDLKYIIDTAENRKFLEEIRNSLFAFGHQFPSPGGGSYYLGDDGNPWKERSRETWITSRMVHVYSMASFLGHEGSTELIDAGLKGLMGELHDTKNKRSFSFARKPGADTCLKESELRKDIISYDPNYRAPLWQSREAAIVGMRSVIPYVDVMKISDEETALLTDIADPQGAAEKLVEMGVPLVAVTLGADGTLVCTKEGSRVVSGFQANMVDTTGAGDSFWGGFLNQLLESAKKPSEVTLDEAIEFARFGNAVASLCVEKRGAIPAMPTLEMIQERMYK